MASVTLTYNANTLTLPAPEPGNSVRHSWSLKYTISRTGNVRTYSRQRIKIHRHRYRLLRCPTNLFEDFRIFMQQFERQNITMVDHLGRNVTVRFRDRTLQKIAFKNYDEVIVEYQEV